MGHARDSDDKSERKTLLLCLLLISVTVGGGAWFLGIGGAPKGGRSGQGKGSHAHSGARDAAKPGGAHGHEMNRGKMNDDALNAGARKHDSGTSHGQAGGGRNEGIASDAKKHHSVLPGTHAGGRDATKREGADAHSRSGGAQPSGRGEMGQDGSSRFPAGRQVRSEFLARGGFSYREVEIRRRLLAAQSLADAGVAAAAPTVIELQEELAALHGLPLPAER